MIITTTKVMRERSASDFYPTPYRLCEAAMKLVRKPERFVLDPGAGTGVWGESIRKSFPSVNLHGVELRSDASVNRAYDAWIESDYLNSDLDMNLQSKIGYDLIIGNPPYSLAEEFIWRSHKLLAADGQMLFLLRLAFLEGQDRIAGLWKTLPPATVYVLPARPSFIPDGPKKNKTDATAYCLMLWDKRIASGLTVLDWINWDNGLKHAKRKSKAV